MNREWEDGTVALVTVDGESVVCIRDASTRHWVGAHDDYWDKAEGGAWCIGSVRPLVVIDPEDREQVERLIRLLVPHDADYAVRSDAGNVARALREFANPKPPKPDEPTGLGAVVEDGEGRRWVRSPSWPDDNRCWVTQDHIPPREGEWCNWSEVDAVRVLSEGVQP